MLLAIGWEGLSDATKRAGPWRSRVEDAILSLVGDSDAREKRND